MQGLVWFRGSVPQGVGEGTRFVLGWGQVAERFVKAVVVVRAELAARSRAATGGRPEERMASRWSAATCFVGFLASGWASAPVLSASSMRANSMIRRTMPVAPTKGLSR